MSDKLFREFITLFKMWPIDVSKGNRCLGAYIRKNFTRTFNKGELSESVNVKEWTKKLSDLNRISDDEYLKKYPRKKGSLAVGSTGKIIFFSKFIFNLAM